MNTATKYDITTIAGLNAMLDATQAERDAAQAVTFGAMSPMTPNDDGGADVFRGGVCVGEIKRATRWGKKSATSRQDAGQVVGYTVEISADGGGWATDPHRVHTLAQARAEARRVLAIA